LKEEMLKWVKHFSPFFTSNHAVCRKLYGKNVNFYQKIYKEEYLSIFMEQQFVARRIATLEQEIQRLKIVIHPSTKKKIVSIKGLFKGMRITEQDLQEAKKSLFKYTPCSI
jgi:uncharacterized small protein (DUF1192 family)